MDFISRFDVQLSALCDRINTRYPSPLSDAMIYALSAGGKRVRPSLVYATANTFDVDLDIVDASALAVECIHTYSLIHDDLPDMDDDELRRGKPTCHIRFNPATAILAGDALQGLAFELLAKNNAMFAAQKTHLLASAAVQMVAGQTLDISAENQTNVTLRELENIHRLKTGELINASVLLGYKPAINFDAVVREKLSDIAFSLGLHFQIMDDIFDVTKTSDEIGKPANSDLKLGKTTYVSLLGLDGAKEKADLLVETIRDDILALGIAHSPLAQIIEKVISRKK